MLAEWRQCREQHNYVIGESPLTAEEIKRIVEAR
jgi:hypothetical protein